MTTPYDTDEFLAEDDASLQIRALNDGFRTQLLSVVLATIHNTLVFTSGVAEYGDDFIERALKAVREFAAFDENNDPYGEHDFGSFDLDNVKLFWKIDYYDSQLEWGSPDPADPEATRRVLTIMLAEEY